MSGVVSIGQQSVQQTLADATRAYAGQGKRFSTALLADASLVSESSIKQYMGGTATPGLPAFLRLLAILGPEWGNALTRMAGYELVPIAAGDVTTYALNNHAAELLKQIAAALADDGRIDHLEEAELAPLVEDMHATSGAWLARRAER